jgi:Coenzyme F420-reducing hydrogenase, beta subunit
MIEINDKTKCSGCHSCSSVCPVKCIEMQVDGEGFRYPKSDKNKCVSCNICEKVCPIINPIETTNIPTVYAAYNKNQEIRMNSSSGGIFTLMAEYVVRLGGVVFGACFNDTFEVVHSYAEKIEELEKFRGSKYVQSVIGDAYSKAKMFLDEGRFVLFTGTPCQIGGLLSYLQRDYTNLYTQDLICHGVPSPMVWRKYLEYREKCTESSVKNVSFRNKDTGWKTYSILMKFKNNVEYKKLCKDDPYMRGFLSELYLRPSCHACSFKTIHHQSDITLADFWGVKYIFPEMDDDKGLSLVLVNSANGQAIFDEIKSEMLINNQTINIAIVEKYNSAIIKSSSANKNRQLFFNNIHKFEFNELIAIYCKVPYKTKIKRLVIKILKTVKRIILRNEV